MSAFEIYLRTGRLTHPDEPIHTKFNPWHDPDDGRFTFAGQGGYFPGRTKLPAGSAGTQSRPLFRVTQYRPNSRIRIGGNGGPPLHDPKTLQDAFPGLRDAPSGAIIGLADNFLELTRPGRILTTELAKAHSSLLVRQIQTLDPKYRLETLEPGGFPSTSNGQSNLINRLRLDRAVAFYRRGEFRPLQLETLRFLQNRVDLAYARGLELLKGGRLGVRLSSQVALGNYVDAQVRLEQREMYSNLGISAGPGEHVQVNRRAYNTPESRYSVPDSRVGMVAFDVSLTAKTLATPQVRNFFRTDFHPNAVVIVRPSQLGPNSTYIIVRPQGR